jgi:hypothetical protein
MSHRSRRFRNEGIANDLTAARWAGPDVGRDLRLVALSTPNSRCDTYEWLY